MVPAVELEPPDWASIARNVSAFKIFLGVGCRDSRGPVKRRRMVRGVLAQPTVPRVG